MMLLKCGFEMPGTVFGVLKLKLMSFWIEQCFILSFKKIVSV